jgi:ABC-2 type transport system permease protein
MKLNQNLRIVWAITVKDITDAVKNKIVQGVLIGVVFMMFSSQAISILMGLKDEPRAYFWDQGNSVLIKEIVRSRELDLHPQDNLSELLLAVSQSAEPVLGIVIPSDFDEQVGSSSETKLPAYYAGSAKSEQIVELRSFFEEQLSIRTTMDLKIMIFDEAQYPPAEGLGYPMMIAFGLVLGVMTIGLLLTPYLIVDEKDTHTLDALLVSPAGMIHVLVGKSLAGLFYSISGSLLIFLFSWRWVVHWDLITVAVILGGLSAVSIGLFVGGIFESTTNVNAVIALLLAGLLLPMYFWTSLITRLHPLVQSVLAGLPSLAMYKLVRLSFAEFASVNTVWMNIAILFSWVIIIFGLVGWRIRRLDR